MILLGKPVTEAIYDNLLKEITDLKAKPLLAVVLVGEDPASLSYVRIKEKIAQKLGVGFKFYHYPEIISQTEIEKLINELNLNQNISGIVVQLPLPEKIDTEKIINLVDVKKDIDGFSGNFLAPTAQAILDILKFYNIDIAGKNIVIVGHGRLVGKPLKEILQKQNISAVVCDSQTPNLKEKTLLADILISAAGVSGLIKPDMVKTNTIIIDAGTSEAGGKMVGDVSPEVYEIAETYTPTPGGVGPVTVGELFKNLVEAAK